MVLWKSLLHDPRNIFWDSSIYTRKSRSGTSNSRRDHPNDHHTAGMTSDHQGATTVSLKLSAGYAVIVEHSQKSQRRTKSISWGYINRHKQTQPLSTSFHKLFRTKELLKSNGISLFYHFNHPNFSFLIPGFTVNALFSCFPIVQKVTRFLRNFYFSPYFQDIFSIFLYLHTFLTLTSKNTSLNKLMYPRYI